MNERWWIVYIEWPRRFQSISSQHRSPEAIVGPFPNRESAVEGMDDFEEVSNRKITEHFYFGVVKAPNKQAAAGAAIAKFRRALESDDDVFFESRGVMAVG